MEVFATNYEVLDDDQVAIEVQGPDGDLYCVIAHQGPARYLMNCLDFPFHPPEALDVQEWLLHPWRPEA